MVRPATGIMCSFMMVCGLYHGVSGKCVFTSVYFFTISLPYLPLAEILTNMIYVLHKQRIMSHEDWAFVSLYNAHRI